MSVHQSSKKRQPHESLRFRIIPPVAQEVLGVGCKVDENYYPADVDQGLGCGIANNCVDAGS